MTGKFAADFNTVQTILEEKGQKYVVKRHYYDFYKSNKNGKFFSAISQDNFCL